MDLKKEKDIIKQLQKCQRNWDYGNVHIIPRVPYIKIQSHCPREIRCIEVK